MKRYLLILLSIILFLGSIGCIFLTIDCFDRIEYFNVEYSELEYGVFTYEKSQKIKAYRSGGQYEIYVEELESPLYISSITSPAVDKNVLSDLEIGEKIFVYYRDSTSTKYIYDACEIKIKNKNILCLDDYAKINSDNQKVGVGVCIFMCIDLIFLSFLCIYYFAKYKKEI